MNFPEKGEFIGVMTKTVTVIFHLSSVEHMKHHYQGVIEESSVTPCHYTYYSDTTTQSPP